MLYMWKFWACSMRLSFKHLRRFQDGFTSEQQIFPSCVSVIKVSKYGGQWNGTEVPFEEQQDEHHFPVRIIKSTTIPPHTEKLIEVTVPVRELHMMIFTPSQHFQQLRWLMVPHAVVKINNYSTYISLIHIV
ncbi:unnamed protein product [Didymodactylos carnosus]|uniref:Uncharacterized protein n=1 Tax=Didymodactylos carnosus TaxID=1234261 RepID=A0A8S2FNT5_9BILA|nr:unnamed protein product [Didymodactylos carnosus]CAF4307600.1 unnamed protein product [Didymodactylos carnosus]